MARLFRVHIARDQMLKAAADYERMARDAEQREIAQGLSYLRALAIGHLHNSRADRAAFTRSPRQRAAGVE
jgi:hypothetical protein